MEPEPDETLVASARGGDDGAFGRLVERHTPRVWGLALRICGDRNDAEEVLQETFLRVHRKLGSFRGEAAFSTWLHRVATNTALLHRRARLRRPADSLEAYLPEFDGEGRHKRIDVDYGAAGRADERVERRELRRELRGALARLPEIYRTAFVLCDLEEIPADEAAGMLGIGRPALRQRLHRARLMLRGFLGHLVGSER